MSNGIGKLRAKGQSVWCDNISRGMIDSGELGRLIDLGVAGVTSNPTILMRAITTTRDYDTLLAALLETGLASTPCGGREDLMPIYEALVIPDIADAADALRPVYDRTQGVDGYVSLEVNPKLADDTPGTVDEARRLYKTLNRPNVMIKVPATEAGFPAVEQLIGEGINVNVTLIFSRGAYENVMRAYIDGLGRFAQAGGDLSGVASVASFFVSRIDTLVDKLLEERRAEGPNVDHLLGRAAVANARLAYARFDEVFGPSGEFAQLAARGARVQRPLWASTSTKNPAYSPTKYVDSLVGPHTVNTLPPATIEETLALDTVGVTIRDDLDATRTLFDELGKLGIDIEDVTDKLRVDGVAAFTRSFDDLLGNLSARQTVRQR